MRGERRAPSTETTTPLPILFVTRKYPPSVGGMETLAAGVWRSIRTSFPEAILIAHGGSNRTLVWWLPVAVLRVFALVLRRRVGVVLTGDAVMCATLRPMLAAFGVPCVTLVMGLDVTFENRVYRSCVYGQLKRASRVIAISRATAECAASAGVQPDRLTVLRLGIDPPTLATDEDRRDAAANAREVLGVPPDTFIVLTLGRLVRRKGARWFVEQVMPYLPDRVHYVVAGDGPEATALSEAIASTGLAGRVHPLGRIADELREVLLIGSDLFVQPNIEVKGDMEGFGLVILEASMRGTPVVAADIEGIRDAVVDGETGLLLRSGAAPEWRAVLSALINDEARLQQLGAGFTAKSRGMFSEEAMAVSLAAELESVQSSIR